MPSTIVDSAILGDIFSAADMRAVFSDGRRTQYYLDIERARFEERLRVRVDVPEELKDVRLPALVLQPIVENAVKHGIAQQERGGEVSIRVRLGRGASPSTPTRHPC